MGDRTYGAGRCLVQLMGQNALRQETSVGAHAARVSLYLAQNFSKRHQYRHIVYDCAGHCLKPPAIADACWVHGCTHILYLDTDVFITNELIDPIEDIVAHFPSAVMAFGIDYYRTIKEPKWHDGTYLMYLTPSNTGMAVVSCTQPLSKRIIASWGYLCQDYSPTGSDQEAYTLLETLPQFLHAGVFVRDTLTLGQYSRFGKHFPGDSGKKFRLHSYIPGERGYRRNQAEMNQSGIYKFMRDRELLTFTEDWRFTGEHSSPPIWYRGTIQNCPNENDLTRLTFPQHLPR